MVSTDLRNNRGSERPVEHSLHLDSLRLISKAKSGDCQAFTALIEPHLRRIYAAAVKITRNHEDAEDACQESVLKAFLHMERYRVMQNFRLG
jgi:RNA polymerase sigma-70 factor (ECF subfamily)